MKYFFILILFIGTALADEPCPVTGQENDFTKMCEEVAIPNCLTRTKLNLAQKGKTNPLCKACQETFLGRAQLDKSEIKSLSQDELKKKKKDLFFEITFQNYKKNITNSLVEITKLRSIEPTRSNFSESIKKCAFKRPEDFTGCSKEMQNYLGTSLTKLQKELSGEVAQLISKTVPKDRDTGLLNRSGSKGLCPIPDRDLLYIQTMGIEESFSPEIIQNLIQSDLSKVTSLNDLFINLIGKGIKNSEQLTSDIQSHPLLSIFANKPHEFISFLQNLNPKSSQGLRNSLYSKENGDQFDERLAKNCQETFETFANTICSQDFSNGDVSVNPFSKSAYFSESLVAIDSSFSADEKTIQKNLAVFGLCQISETKGKLNLDEKLNEINQNLREDQAELPLKDYRGKKYEEDISTLNDVICNIAAGKTACIDGTPNCEAYKRYKTPSPIDKKFAESSNNEINSLLSSFLGKPKELTPEVKTILISEGILPKDDGTMVAQAEVPERQSGYFSSAPAAKPQQKVMPVTSGSANVASSARSGSYAAPSQYAANASFASDSSPMPMPNFSDLMGDDRDLNDIQNEIMRRLSKLPKGRPVSKEDARRIVRDSFRTKGRQLPHDREDRFASRLMGPHSRDNDYYDGQDGFRDLPSNDRGMASANMKSAAEKYKADGMNRALADMGGARKAMETNDRAPASANDEKSKALTTVALNISEDPKVSLSKIFSEKLNANDPETKLLKVLVESKENFLLEIRGLSFKVVFDQNQKMNLLLSQGDKQVAENLRPQLEVFFKRLMSL